MAEDPASWGPLEVAISEAIRDANAARERGLIGLSTVRRIADRLRDQGLVVERREPDDSPTPGESSSPIGRTRGGIAP